MQPDDDESDLSDDENVQPDDDDPYRVSDTKWNRIIGYSPSTEDSTDANGRDSPFASDDDEPLSSYQSRNNFASFNEQGPPPVIRTTNDIPQRRRRVGGRTFRDASVLRRPDESREDYRSRRSGRPLYDGSSCSDSSSSDSDSSVDSVDRQNSTVRRMSTSTTVSDENAPSNEVRSFKGLNSCDDDDLPLSSLLTRNNSESTSSNGPDLILEGRSSNYPVQRFFSAISDDSDSSSSVEFMSVEYDDSDTDDYVPILTKCQCPNCRYNCC